jgi:predicted amidophosphoribosyltransferase
MTALDAVTSVVFPGPCRLCEELLTRSSALPLCDRCLSSFQPLPGRICAVCGRPLEARATPEGEALKCRFCSAGGYGFDAARSYAAYEGALVRAIVILKFEEMAPLGNWFAQRLAEVVQRGGETLAADVVVPVPLHGDRLRERATTRPS